MSSVEDVDDISFTDQNVFSSHNSGSLDDETRRVSPDRFPTDRSIQQNNDIR